MEIVYVAHRTALAAGADVGGRASAEVLHGFDDAAHDLADEVRAHLQASHLRGAAQHWHFQRRDGAIADQLIAAADDLARRHGPDASVVIVVGRAEHGYHHLLGSVPRTLERHNHYPVIVIP
jgi:nucleotide-binding universal stress UspA family protein